MQQAGSQETPLCPSHLHADLTCGSTIHTLSPPTVQLLDKTSAPNKFSTTTNATSLRCLLLGVFGSIVPPGNGTINPIVTCHALHPPVDKGIHLGTCVSLPMGRDAHMSCQQVILNASTPCPVHGCRSERERHARHLKACTLGKMASGQLATSSCLMV